LIVTSHCCSIPSGATATGSASGSARTRGRPAEPGTSSGAASPFRQPRRVATTLRGSGHSARVPGGQREDPARGLERGTVPHPRRLPRSRHDDEVDASSGALKMLNHQMKSWASKNFIGKKPAAARRKGRHEATAEGSNPRPSRWEPRVRIHFPPAASRVRTRLAEEVAKLSTSLF